MKSTYQLLGLAWALSATITITVLNSQGQLILGINLATFHTIGYWTGIYLHHTLNQLEKS